MFLASPQTLELSWRQSVANILPPSDNCPREPCPGSGGGNICNPARLLPFRKYGMSSLATCGREWQQLFHRQTNKLNNYLILFNLFWEFVCVFFGHTHKKNKQTDRSIELLRN